MRRLTPLALVIGLLPAGCLYPLNGGVAVPSSTGCNGAACKIGGGSSLHCTTCEPNRPCIDCGPSSWLKEKCWQHKIRDCADDALDAIEDAAGKDFSDDFEDGFEQAYVDLAMGGTGVTPPVPPSKYWTAYYRSPAGHEHVHDWFSGYELGAQHARDAGIQTTARVLSSWATQGCMPTYQANTATSEPAGILYSADVESIPFQQTPSSTVEPLEAPQTAATRSVRPRPPRRVRRVELPTKPVAPPKRVALPQPPSRPAPAKVEERAEGKPRQAPVSADYDRPVDETVFFPVPQGAIEKQFYPSRRPQQNFQAAHTPAYEPPRVPPTYNRMEHSVLPSMSHSPVTDYRSLSAGHTVAMPTAPVAAADRIIQSGGSPAAYRLGGTPAMPAQSARHAPVGAYRMLATPQPMRPTYQTPPTRTFAPGFGNPSGSYRSAGADVPGRNASADYRSSTPSVGTGTRQPATDYRMQSPGPASGR